MLRPDAISPRCARPRAPSRRRRAGRLHRRSGEPCAGRTRRRCRSDPEAAGRNRPVRARRTGRRAAAQFSGTAPPDHDRTAEMAVTALDFVGVAIAAAAPRPTAASTAAGSRATSSSPASAWCCRAVPTNRPAPGLVAVKREDLQPGDLVFFNTLKRTFSHVGIYIGANRFVHAPRPGAEVRTEDMTFAYWRSASPARVDPRGLVAPRRRTGRSATRSRLQLGRARRARRPSAGASGEAQSGMGATRSSPSPTTVTAPRADGSCAPPRADGHPHDTPAVGRCATCASRSPTAATSAAATACRRRCSTSDYAFLPHVVAAHLRGDHARSRACSSPTACARSA